MTKITRNVAVTELKDITIKGLKILFWGSLIENFYSKVLMSN